MPESRGEKAAFSKRCQPFRISVPEQKPPRRDLPAKTVRNQLEPLTRDLLAQRKAGASRRPISRYVAQLRAACLRDQPGACLRSAKGMMKAGIDAGRIADIYVPAVAQALGEDWVADRNSFADVTLGASRLQSLLRELDEAAALHPYGDGPAVLVATAAEAHHTLGAVLLAGQLRRQGFSVRLLLGARPADLQQQLRQSGYDAVFLSASRSEDPQVLRRLVEAARPVPLVLGGGLLELGPEVVAQTRAPLATSDLSEALRLCNLARPAPRVAS